MTPLVLSFYSYDYTNRLFSPPTRHNLMTGQK